MTDYPYVQSWFDYGVRNAPTLGLLYHMASGGGTVGYLDNKGNPPTRGVSVHVVCEYDGTVVQMLPWSHASGSLNPDDRSTDKAYYGHQHLVDVLGSYWTNPNIAVLSMEIEGFVSPGPNATQVAAAIAWGNDMKQRFPELRGAIGHADQTDTKPCPGTSAAMKAIFEGVGGHGLWHKENDVPWFPIRVPGGARAGSLAIPTGTDLFPVSGAAPIKATSALVETDATSAIHDIDGGSAGFIFTTDATYWVRAADVGFTPTDCSAQVEAAVAKEHEDNRKAALAAVDEAIP